MNNDAPLKTIEEHNAQIEAQRNTTELGGLSCPSCALELKWTQTHQFIMPPSRCVSCLCGWNAYVS